MKSDGPMPWIDCKELTVYTGDVFDSLCIASCSQGCYSALAVHDGRDPGWLVESVLLSPDRDRGAQRWNALRRSRNSAETELRRD